MTDQEIKTTEDDSSTSSLDYLRERVRRLSDLLDDPQPGLIVWSMQYGSTMQDIVNFWNGERDD